MLVELWNGSSRVRLSGSVRSSSGDSGWCELSKSARCESILVPLSELDGCRNRASLRCSSRGLLNWLPFNREAESNKKQLDVFSLAQGCARRVSAPFVRCRFE